MSQVPAVRGPVEVADLGPADMHEHIFVLTADVQQNYPGEALGTEVPDPMAAMFVADVTEGITGTGVKAACSSRVI
jgi:phosphotriesterase-related protein